MEDCNWKCMSPTEKVVEEARLNNQAVPVSGICGGKEKSAQNLCRPEKAVVPKGWKNGGFCWDGGEVWRTCWTGDRIGGFCWPDSTLGGFWGIGGRTGGLGCSIMFCWQPNRFKEPIEGIGVCNPDGTDKSSMICAGGWENITLGPVPKSWENKLWGTEGVSWWSKPLRILELFEGQGLKLEEPHEGTSESTEKDWWKEGLAGRKRKESIEVLLLDLPIAFLLGDGFLLLLFICVNLYKSILKFTYKQI